MNNRVTATLMVATIVVAATGSGIALGASTHPAVKACASKSGDRLGLLSHNKCAKGYAKVTLGTQGPRGKTGKTGPQGPGAIYQQITPNADLQDTFEHNVAGIKVEATCGQLSSVSVTLVPAESGQTMEFYGTQSQGATLAVIQENADATLTLSNTKEVTLDAIARAGDADFVDLRISGLFDTANDKCMITEVAVPASLPAS